MKKKCFEIKLRLRTKGERFYYSNGVIQVEDDQFVGYSTIDYLKGSYNKETEEFSLLMILNGVNGKEQEYHFTARIYQEDFEFPNTFYLQDENEISAIFTVCGISEILPGDFERNLAISKNF